jgi:hypothetical protein
MGNAILGRQNMVTVTGGGIRGGEREQPSRHHGDTQEQGPFRHTNQPHVPPKQPLPIHTEQKVPECARKNDESTLFYRHLGSVEKVAKVPFEILLQRNKNP